MFPRADSAIPCFRPIRSTKFAAMGMAGLSICWEAAAIGSNDTLWGIVRNSRRFLFQEDLFQEKEEQEEEEEHVLFKTH